MGGLVLRYERCATIIARYVALWCSGVVNSISPPNKSESKEYGGSISKPSRAKAFLVSRTRATLCPSKSHHDSRYGVLLEHIMPRPGHTKARTGCTHCKDRSQGRSIADGISQTVSFWTDSSTGSAMKANLNVAPVSGTRRRVCTLYLLGGTLPS